MDDLHSRFQKLNSEQNYLRQYVDSIEFLLIGIALGTLGGIWGNVLKDFLFQIFGDSYILVLSLISLLIFVGLMFPIRRARRILEQQKSELSEISKEIEKTFPT